MSAAVAIASAVGALVLAPATAPAQAPQPCPRALSGLAGVSCAGVVERHVDA